MSIDQFPFAFGTVPAVTISVGVGQHIALYAVEHADDKGNPAVVQQRGTLQNLTPGGKALQDGENGAVGTEKIL